MIEKENFNMENLKLLVKRVLTTIMGAWIGERLGVLFPLLVLLTVLMIADQVSGILASKKEALDYPNDNQYGISSKKFIKGIYKKAGYILIILVAISTDYIIFKFSSEIRIEVKYNTIFGLLITVWLITNELLSILENAGRMGAVLPEFLKKILSELRNNIEDKSNL